MDKIERQVRAAERRHIEALGNSLAHLRHICNDTAERGEVLKTEASKQFARQLAGGILSAEDHVKAMEESLTSPAIEKQLTATK